MAKHLVVTADAARASLYCLDTHQDPASTIPPQLVEKEALVNPIRRQRQSEVFSEPRPGVRQGAIGGAPYGVDDHRSAHQDAEERRFAEVIVASAQRLASELDAQHVVLTAPPRMLGHLRATSSDLRQGGLEVDELAKDYTKMRPQQVHERLAAENLLPEPQRFGL